MTKTELEKKIDVALANALDKDGMTEEELKLLEAKINTIRKLSKPES